MCHLTTCLCTSVDKLFSLCSTQDKKLNIIQGEREHKKPSATSSRPNNKRGKSRLIELNLMHVQKQWHVSSCTVCFFSHSNTSSRVSQGQACRHRQAHITPSLITEAGIRPWEKQICNTLLWLYFCQPACAWSNHSKAHKGHICSGLNCSVPLSYLLWYNRDLLYSIPKGAIEDEGS